MNPADLVRIFVRHRNAANLLMALMLIAGLFALKELRTQFFPDTGLDIITVTVVWPGASAEDADANIVAAIEPEVRFTDGVKQVNSYSSEGRATVVVEFEAGSDMQAALADIDAAVSGITTLPEDAEEPLIKRVVRYDLISKLSISGNVPEATLRAWAKTIRDDLLDRGIDRVSFYGLRDPEIHVDVPPESLRRLDMTLGDVAGVVAGISVDMPSGDIGGAAQKQIRSVGELKRADDLAGIELRAQPGGETLLLRDVARVQETFDPDQPTGRRDARQAIELIVERSTTTDALTAAGIVENYIADMKPTLPRGIELVEYDVQAGLIVDRIRLLLNNGVSGLVLVLIVLYLFLNGHVAFWVAMGIPTAILATLGVMLFTGQSINMVSLFAMIMTLGMVVDDAIVVGEHSAHLRSTGLSPQQAAEQGALRMLAPVTASALTTIAAFLPLFMVGDVIGQIIIAIPLVVVSVLTCSLLECFLVLPGHLRGALDAATKAPPRWRVRFDAGFDRFRDRTFRRAVQGALDYRYVTFGISLAGLIVAVGLLMGGRISFVFMPSPEADVIDANIEMAAGTSRAETEAALDALGRAMRAAEAKLAGPDGVLVVMNLQRVGQSQGQSFQRLSGDHIGGMQVELVPSDTRDVRTPEFIAAWRAELPVIAGLRRVVMQERQGGPPGRELDVRLIGDNVDQLKRAAEDVKLELQRHDGVSDIEDDLPWGKQELILELTPRGRALGFTTESVARQVRDAFEGAIAKRFPRDDEEVTIRVQLPVAEATEATVRDLYVRSPSGAETPLEEVVDFREASGFARIRRKDGQREVAIQAEIDESRTNANNIVALLDSGPIQEIAARHGVTYRFAGKAEEQAETFGDMQTGAQIGLAAIYIILAWVFASYAKPFIVMAIIPFGIVGAVFGHLLLGYDLSMMSMVALIGLAGILVNNSIILVSTIDERTARGEDLLPAIVSGTCDRLRAVTLTSVTTIVGLTPLLFETSLQAQFLIPMAVTIVFGLGGASLLVLFVVPALLGILHDIGRLSRRVQPAVPAE